VLVAVSYGYKLRRHLDLCLQALARQTLRPRVVVCHDTSFDADPGVEAWLRGCHPWVEYVPTRYMREAGSNISRNRNAIFDVATGEDVIAWIDGEVIFARDGIERIAAAIDADHNTVIAFPRQRVMLPERLPDVLLEPIMDRELALVSEPRPDQVRTAKGLTGSWAWHGTALATGICTGPARAIHRDHAFRYDESFRGKWAEDNDWSMTAVRGKGLRPQLGPTAYHIEHPGVGDTEHGISGEESRRLNVALIHRKWGPLGEQVGDIGRS
jgi:hypothetical protein